jgi:hypothetical protein
MKPNFDTLAAYNHLISKGMTSDQANVYLEVLKDSQSDLVTKDDFEIGITALKTELKTSISGLEWQMKGVMIILSTVAGGVWYLISKTI